MHLTMSISLLVTYRWGITDKLDYCKIGRKFGTSWCLHTFVWRLDPLTWQRSTCHTWGSPDHCFHVEQKGCNMWTNFTQSSFAITMSCNDLPTLVTAYPGFQWRVIESLGVWNLKKKRKQKNVSKMFIWFYALGTFLLVLLMLLLSNFVHCQCQWAYNFILFIIIIFL
jgi:hypothetical protein